MVEHHPKDLSSELQQYLVNHPSSKQGGMHTPPEAFYTTLNNEKDTEKLDRLPAFTLNYLELMEGCRQSQMNKAGTNPFVQSATAASRGAGVFLESRVPTEKKQPFMGRRQHMLSQPYSGRQTQQGHISEKNQDLYSDFGSLLLNPTTPHMTVNRLTAVVHKSSEKIRGKNMGGRGSSVSPQRLRNEGLANFTPGIDPSSSMGGVMESEDFSATRLQHQYRSEMATPDLHSRVAVVDDKTAKRFRQNGGGFYNTGIGFRHDVRSNTSQKSSPSSNRHPLNFHYHNNQHFKQLLHHKHMLSHFSSKQQSKFGAQNIPVQDPTLGQLSGIMVKQLPINPSKSSAPTSSKNDEGDGSQRNKTPNGLRNLVLQHDERLSQPAEKRGQGTFSNLQGWSSRRSSNNNPHFGGGGQENTDYMHSSDQMQNNTFRMGGVGTGGDHKNSMFLIEERNVTGSSMTQPQILTARHTQHQKSVMEVTYVPIPLNQIKISTCPGQHQLQHGVANVGSALGLQSHHQSQAEYYSQQYKLKKQDQKQMGKFDSESPPYEDMLMLMHMQNIENGDGHQNHHPLDKHAQQQQEQMLVKKFGKIKKGKPPPWLMMLPMMTRDEIEQLVPWRYSSKDYFLRRAAPLSPSSLAPKGHHALSTETASLNKTQKGQRTQQQRMFLRDNPQFFNSLEEYMLQKSTTSKANNKDNNVTLAESPRNDGSPRPPISNKLLVAAVSKRQNVSPSPAQASPIRDHNQGMLDGKIQQERQKYDELREKVVSATNHLKPSRLKDYHNDAHENSPVRKKSTMKIRPSQQLPTKEIAAGFKSSIENDKKNLNNVFGIPLKSHWVFRQGAVVMVPPLPLQNGKIETESGAARLGTAIAVDGKTLESQGAYRSSIVMGGSDALMESRDTMIGQHLNHLSQPRMQSQGRA